MALTLETNARDAACNAVVDLLDGGDIQIKTSADAVLATLPLNTTAFGAASSGAAAMGVSPAVSASASATGTAAKAVFRTSGAANVFTATVATSGADINLNSVNIESGATVDITSFTYTQPAS